MIYKKLISQSPNVRAHRCGCSYIYEFADEFAAFPTYPVVLGFKGTDQDAVSFPSPAMLSAAKMYVSPRVTWRERLDIAWIAFRLHLLIAYYMSSPRRYSRSRLRVSSCLLYDSNADVHDCDDVLLSLNKYTHTYIYIYRMKAWTPRHESRPRWRTVHRESEGD